jgi:hypothetical protein
MTADLHDVIAALHRDGARTAASLDLLATLSSDDAVAALIAARFPQYAFRAVESLGARLAEAFARKAASHTAVVSDTPVLLGGLLAAAKRDGRPLDARYDPWLASALSTWWADEVHVLLAEGLAALPPRRREAVVFVDPTRIAWRYLSAVSSESARRLAVRLASIDPRDNLFPSSHHEVVVGLTSLAPSAAPLLAAALRSGDGSRAGRRILAASLARLDGETDTLRACLDDPDPLVRRLARDGFDHRHLALAPAARVPDACLHARALRASITDDERRTMDRLLRDAARDAADSKRTLDVVFDAMPAPTPSPMRAFAAACDLWIDALRSARWEPPLYVYELFMRRCLLVAPDDADAPWLVADALCRIPPVELDPMRAHHAFLALPEAHLGAVVKALGATLSPEDAGNPLGLYDWLAARADRDAPAFARGVVDPDPRLKLICARATGRRATPAGRWSLDRLRQAFEGIRANEHHGSFGLLAIDHAAQHWEASTWLDPHDDAAALRALDEALMAVTLAGPLSPDEAAQRSMTALAAADPQVTHPSWEPCEFEAFRAQLIDVCVSDDHRATRVEATLRVEALMAVVDPSVRCLAASSVANVAWSQGWFFQHPEGRYAVTLVYLNDQ